MRVFGGWMKLGNGAGRRRRSGRASEREATCTQPQRHCPTYMYLITVKARALGRYSLRQQAKRMWLRQTTKPWSMAVGNPPDSPRYSSHVTLSRLENSSRLFSLYTQCRAQNSWLSYYCIMLLLQCVPFVHVYLPSRTPKHAGNLWPSLL